MIEVVSEPIDVAAVMDAVSGPDAGAVVLFLGTVRDHTGEREVRHLDYEAYGPMACAEMETLARYNFPAKIVVLNNGGIGPGMPEIPDDPMMNMKPNALIYGARYDRMMEDFGGKGFFVEDPKDLRKALDEAMAFDGPALVNVVISQSSSRKPQQFNWH